MHGKYIIEEAVRLRDRGKFSEAIQTLNKLNDANSKSAHVFSLIAHCHILNNDLSEALSFLNKAKEIDPSIPSIGWNEARLLLRQKNIPTALRIAQETNARFPNDSEGLGVLGSCLKASNQLEKSLECLNKALSLDPNYPEALINRGLIYLSQKNISACLIDLEAAFELKPNFTPIWPILINLKMERKEYAETIPIIRKMVSIEPNDAENFAKLALCHQHQKELNESVIAYKKAIELKPSFVEARNNLGMVLQNLGQFDEAILVLNEAIKIDHNSYEAHYNLGNVFQEIGYYQDALQSYKESLKIKPDFAKGHRVLSGLKSYEKGDKHISMVNSLLQKSDSHPSDRCHLLYAAAKIQEDLGNYESALQNYISGGKLRQNLLNYNSNKDKVLYSEILQTWSKISKLSLDDRSFSLSSKPIFIVGMPRSGTTLAEQIISCHSEVEAAGELPYLYQYAGRLGRGHQATSVNEIRKIREAYITALHKHSGGKRFVTDKTPQNFLLIGLISKAIPEAKIVHVKRDAAATCFSNFKHYFAAENGLGYSYSLEDTARYYRQYQSLMEHWSKYKDISVHHLDYEKLTLDPEPIIRKLLEFLELKWEDPCLSPQDNMRAIKTASQHQVRKKIYSGSSQSWKKFKPYLHGMLDNL